MRTLLIDNYDSFTFNLFHLLAEVNGEEPIVVRNNEASWEDLARLEFDNIVISPGPGTPCATDDFGVCAEAIRRSEVPLLGVCLGHQGIGWVHDGRVVPAPEAMHGRLSPILHEGAPLFAGIPRRFQAVRYHSLCVEQPLPEDLEPIAWTDDGVLMAVAHRWRLQWGVQFHPESICTEHGRLLLANFRDLTTKHTSKRSGVATTVPDPTSGAEPCDGHPVEGRPTLKLEMARLDALYDAERAFLHLYGDSTEAFWLDSMADGCARFSFMGCAGGPFSATISYDVNCGEVQVERGGETEVLHESIFDYLNREIRRLRFRSDDLPFDFNCGFVGYFGYELKADCEGSRAHESSLPDAALIFADRLIVFDHLERHTYVLCVTEPGGVKEARRWVAETSLRLESLPPAPELTREENSTDGEPVEFRLRRSREQYLKDIATCKRRLAEGETYEVCLTNEITAEVAPDPLSLYRTLRRINPAPFAAFVRFGETAVLSSSPERFLSVGRDRWLEAKPIKGTCRRGESQIEDLRLARDLRASEKAQAENLMATDVLRNDLGVVCEVGSVEVSQLMRVETYETVHQLVSTVRGRLRAGLETPDCIRACFPGGSMTGAPKKRTMEIIDELENGARGIYSGAIGYLGLAGGCDLSIAIRVIVVDGETVTIGTGGAIVTQSDPEDEYLEILLKARAPMEAIDHSTSLLTILGSAPRGELGNRRS